MARGLAKHYTFILIILAFFGVDFLFSQSVSAVAKLVQVKTASINGTSVSATLSPAATPKHLIIVVCAGRSAINFTTPAGFTVATSETTAPAQEIFYKVAAGGEATVSCAGGISGRRGIQLYEYSGTEVTNPLEAINGTPSIGNTDTALSGVVNVPAVRPNALLLAAVVFRTSGTGISSWTNSFTERADFTNTARFGGADYYTSTANSYSTSAKNSIASSWRGQIVAFKLLPIGLSGDIVDASNVTIPSPSVAFVAKNFDFNCQASTATLGTTTQQLRVVNTKDVPAWTLSIAATNGPTAVWSGGGTKSYDFNDPTSAGCGDGSDSDGVAGQLTVDPSAATITADTSCSSTGLSKGVSTAFNQGTTDSIQLVIGSASAEVNCMWNITGISLSQQIPPEPEGASYSLGLTLTLTSN